MFCSETCSPLCCNVSIQAAQVLHSFTLQHKSHTRVVFPFLRNTPISFWGKFSALYFWLFRSKNMQCWSGCKVIHLSEMFGLLLLAVIWPEQLGRKHLSLVNLWHMQQNRHSCTQVSQFLPAFSTLCPSSDQSDINIIVNRAVASGVKGGDNSRGPTKSRNYTI